MFFRQECSGQCLRLRQSAVYCVVVCVRVLYLCVLVFDAHLCSLQFQCQRCRFTVARLSCRPQLFRFRPRGRVKITDDRATLGRTGLDVGDYVSFCPSLRSRCFFLTVASGCFLVYLICLVVVVVVWLAATVVVLETSSRVH